MVQQVSAGPAQDQGMLHGDWMDYGKANLKAVEPLKVGVPVCIVACAICPPLAGLAALGVALNLLGAGIHLGANVTILAANRVTNLAAGALGL